MSVPYMPLYVTDFEADTTHLTLLEDGIYNRLLRLCWRTSGCSVPNDDKWIMRRLRVDAETYEENVKPIIGEFFTLDKGRLFSKRQQAEHQRITDTSKKLSAAGKKGGRKPKSLKTNEIDLSPALASPKQLEPEPEPKPEPNIDTASTGEIGNQPDLNDLNERLLAAIGEAGNQAATGLVNLQRPLAWLEAGCDLEQDILPTIKAVADRQLQKMGQGCVGAWRYFDKPVMQAKAERLKPLPKLEATHGTGNHYGGTQRSKSGEKRSAHLEAIRAAGDQVSRDQLGEQDHLLISGG